MPTVLRQGMAMGSKKKKELGNTSSKSRKDVVDSIIREASEMGPSQERENAESLEKEIRESEAKRLVLAQALHASREQMRRYMPGHDAEKDKAQPFGVF